MASALRNEPPVLRSALIPVRKNIIEANETIVTPVQSARTGQRYILERPIFGEALSVARILDELADDEITAVLRLNTDTWTSEDITEEVARKFLYDMDEREGVELDDENRFPAYVRNSRAWALWKDDIQASAPVSIDPDRRHDERRDHQAMGLEAAE
jgi:hypothetical protein